jgi:hypothetical protein
MIVYKFLMKNNFPGIICQPAKPDGMNRFYFNRKGNCTPNSVFEFIDIYQFSIEMNELKKNNLAIVNEK